MGHGDESDRVHELLAEAVRPFQGRKLTADGVGQAFRQHVNDAHAAGRVDGADHCSNHRNEGGCWCAGTPAALFTALGGADPFLQPFLVLTPEPSDKKGQADRPQAS